MAQPSVERYSKRKRVEITYYESDTDDSVADVIDEPDVECFAKKKAKTNHSKAADSKPLPKQKIFPFAKLPAELKNQIYDLALKDPNGLILLSKTVLYRRCVRRGTQFPVSSQYHRRGHWGNRVWNRHLSSQSQDGDAPETNAELYPLVPNLLLLNKETYAETKHILYNNKFSVEDTVTMHSFLATIGPKNCASLVDITLKGWGLTKTHKALNYPAFTLLSSAVNLRRLHLDCRLAYSSGGVKTARQLYRDGFHWFEAVAIAKGKFDAAIDVVSISKDNIGTAYHGWTKQSPEEEVSHFRGELQNLLRRSPGLPGGYSQWKR